MTCSGSLIAIALYHDLTGAICVRMLAIGCNVWLFFVLVMTYTLLIASFGKEGGAAATLSSSVTLAFYFLYFMSRLRTAIAFTKPINIFTYCQPQMIMFGERHFLHDVTVLLSLTGVCLAIAVWQFMRRDIP